MNRVRFAAAFSGSRLARFGATVLGFMGGCLWGFASSRQAGPSLPLLSSAAVPAVIACLLSGALRG